MRMIIGCLTIALSVTPCFAFSVSDFYGDWSVRISNKAPKNCQLFHQRLSSDSLTYFDVSWPNGLKRHASTTIDKDTLTIVEEGREGIEERDTRRILHIVNRDKLV